MNVGMLVSWHYLRSCVSKAMPGIRKVRTVLDSGAFSAASSGAPINLTEYARFIRQNGPAFDWCASLDVIGDPERSYANWTALRASWPDVVPAVHCGSDLRWVTRYIQDGAHRIAFGGLVPHAKTLRHSGSPARQWLDAAFAAVHGQGVAVHGFGVTGRSIVFAYPWTTVDSSVALAKTRFREVLQPDGRALAAYSEASCAGDARRLADPWEVRAGSPTRRARLKANFAGAEQALSGSTLQALYHAVPPSGDTNTLLDHLLQNGHGA